MKKSHLVLAGRVFLAIALVATVAVAQNDAGKAKSGPVKLVPGGPFDKDKVTEVKLGEKVEVVAKLRAGEFMDQLVAFGNADLNNTSDQPMFYAYYVAFFDADRQLVACQSQASMPTRPLEPGKKTSLGSCIMPLSQADIDRIASYQVRFVESDKPIGGK